MVLRISTGVIDGLLTDEAAYNTLEECYQRHMSGDKAALMCVLMTCAAYQAVIPDWAVDELLTLDDRIQSGEVRDLNKFFGFEPEHVGAHSIYFEVSIIQKGAIFMYSSIISRVSGSYFELSNRFFSG